MENTAFEQGRRKLAEWQRGGTERRLAGVCAAIARQLDLPLPLVRALFIVAAVVPSTRSAAVLLYLALWFLTPPEPGEPSGLDRVVNAVSSFGFGARRSEGADAGGSAYGAEGGRGAGYGGSPYGGANGGGRIGAQRDGAEGEAGAAER